MPDPAEPTNEEQPTQIAQPDPWEGDFKPEDLTIPYKREEIAEDAKEEPAPDEDTVDAGGELVEVDEPTPAITAQDPGDYQPADYSFEVTLANGKTVTVKTPEDADTLSEDPDNFETPKQLLDFIKKSTAMQSKLDKDHEKWEGEKKTYTEQYANEQQRQEAITGIANEMEYLVGKSKLPKVAKEYRDADWSDPEVAKQPGVKEQLALLQYMTKENKVREKAGIKPFGPVDAYTAMQSDAAEIAKAEKAKEAGQQRKAASSRVAGVAPAASAPHVPNGIAVGRTGVFDRGAAMWD